MLAFGLLVGVHTNAATPVERAVVLASFDSVMIPNSPLDEELWWFGRSGSHRSERPEAPRLTYADAAVARPMIGPGGWLIGNGEDAPVASTDAGGCFLGWGGAGGAVATLASSTRRSIPPNTRLTVPICARLSPGASISGHASGRHLDTIRFTPPTLPMASPCVRYNNIR